MRYWSHTEADNVPDVKIATEHEKAKNAFGVFLQKPLPIPTTYVLLYGEPSKFTVAVTVDLPFEVLQSAFCMGIPAEQGLSPATQGLARPVPELRQPFGPCTSNQANLYVTSSDFNWF